MSGATPGPVVARLARPTAEHTRLAVVADPHVAVRAEGTSKLFERTQAHFAAALDDIAERGVDAVLSPGDLTKDGEPWNYEAVDDALATLDAPFYAVPGNHDVPKNGDGHDAPPLARFADEYGPGELPYRVEVGGVDVLGLNSAGAVDRLTDTHDGRVDEAQREWLAAELDATETPIVLVHHNFPPVTGQLSAHREAVEPEMAEIPGLRDADPLAATLADGGAALALTGHYHLPATGVHRGVREVATPTTCSFPQSYLLVDVTPAGTTIRLVPVADETGLETAHARRVGDSTTARALTSIAAARVASFPLVEEWSP